MGFFLGKRTGNGWHVGYGSNGMHVGKSTPGGWYFGCLLYTSDAADD